MSEEKNASKAAMEKLKLNLKELQQITGGRKTAEIFLNLSGGWTSDGQVLILLGYGFSNVPYGLFNHH